MAMSLRRWDPFRDLMAIQSEMNRLFGRTYGSEDGDADIQGTWAPAVDVFQTDDRFTVVAELPGLTGGDVDITVEDGVLTLKGERKFYNEVSEESFHRVERRFGAFVRRIALPQHSDTSRVEASMKDGILRIEVPKAEQAKPKRIEVKAAAGSDPAADGS